MTGHSTNIFLISPQAKSPQARGKLVERLEKCFNTAKEKTAKAKQVADDIQEHFNELSSLTLEIHLRTNFQEAIEQSALKIQKVFRGYTVRSYYDEVIFYLGNSENSEKNSKWVAE